MTMVPVTTVVKSDLLDISILSTSSNQLADFNTLCLFVALEATKIYAQSGSNGQGTTDGVIGSLSGDVAGRAMYDEARCLGGAMDVLA